jgi:hypothetical protein
MFQISVSGPDEHAGMSRPIEKKDRFRIYDTRLR